MNNFRFQGKIDEQINEFREFLKDFKDLSKLEIVFEVNDELTMGDILNGIEKINEIIPNPKITLDFGKSME